MFYARPFIVAMALLALWPLQAVAEGGIGTLKTLTGTAHLAHAGATAQDMKQGDAVAMDDFIETDAGSRAVFGFADGAELVMTGKGRLVIDEYVFDADKKTGNKAVLDIFESAFSYTGGALDKGAKPEVKLNIDYGTIGIRGTKLIGARRNGITWVYLSEGGAVFENTGGTTDLAPGYGTRIRSKADAPAPAYLWGPEEVAWLQRFVDDAGVHETPAMASNMSTKKTVEKASRAEGAMPAASAPAAPSEGPSANEAGSARGRVDGSAAQMTDKAKSTARPEILLVRSAAPGKNIVMTEDSAGTLRLTTDLPAIAQLSAANVIPENLEGKQLYYMAELNAVDLKGAAHLEFHVLLSGGKTGYVFGRDAPDSAVTATDGWKTVTGSFALQHGERPAQIKASLVIDGMGSVLVRNLRLVGE